MYSSSTCGGNSCSAHITTNRNRFKVYGDSIYLKDQQKFEIELFNPNFSSYLAKIKINGNEISNSGILLKPGQRVYLERFIDSNNKFVFETYSVDNEKESLDAIKQNGLVEISFYPEITTSTYYSNPYSFTTYNSGILSTTLNSNSVTIQGSNASNLTYTSGLCNFSTAGTTVSDMSCFSSDFSSDKSLETGRVEKGEGSSQNLSLGYGNFGYIPSNVVSYKLIPESYKPVEVEKIRNYCTGCGNRMRKETWKFCPNCGEQF